jgi:hypothetical protein
MLYMVSDDGNPEPPWTFTDDFNRPDVPQLGNGWSVVTGSFMIQSLEARNETTSTFSLAVRPGLMGATQTVAASFASTDNNSSPRFGVVVRYQDLQNYYMCYRQLGGSSTVRIAKVQNGAETVLKSAPDRQDRSDDDSCSKQITLFTHDLDPLLPRLNLPRRSIVCGQMPLGGIVADDAKMMSLVAPTPDKVQRPAPPGKVFFRGKRDATAAGLWP